MELLSRVNIFIFVFGDILGGSDISSSFCLIPYMHKEGGYMHNYLSNEILTLDILMQLVRHETNRGLS